MPRPPRLHVPGGFYHVTLRGNHREALFVSAADRTVLNEIVAEVLERFRARLHAFCWMANHLHALMQISDRPLGELMKRVAMRYSRYRHKALRTTGHLFERRYRAKLIEVDEYFLSCIRYIHMNPVKASMVRDPSEYPWQSHRAYLGREHIPWLTTEYALAMFSPQITLAREAYRRFMGEAAEDYCEEDSHPEDPRVLGGDQFLSRIPLVPYKPRSRLTLEELAVSICMSSGVSVDLIRSRSSARALTPIRLAIARRAIDARIATLAEVARFLGRNPSTLCRQLQQHSPERQ